MYSKFFIFFSIINIKLVTSFFNIKSTNKKFHNILNSHFSRISTNLKNKDTLVKSISKVSNCTIFSNSLNVVRGYNGNDVLAEIVIRQNNGVDIGFKLNNDIYEFIADLQFWDQTIPPDFFLEKITQNYALETVLESCGEEGFITNSITSNNMDYIINVEVSRYKE